MSKLKLLLGIALTALSADPILAQGSDSCSTAQQIAGDGFYDFDNSSADTDGPGSSLCSTSAGDQVAHDVWFDWTASATGYVTISTCGLSDVDTMLAGYQGAGCPTGAPLDCNDDSCGLRSVIQFSVTAGQVYGLRVGTFPNASGGTGSIFINTSPTATNDDCQSAEAITGDGVFPYDNTLATTDSSAYANCPSGPSMVDDVWFAWTAQQSAPVEVTTCGLSDYDTMLGVYDGAPCNGGDAISCIDDSCDLRSKIVFGAVAGNTYWLRVGNYPGTTTGPGSISVTSGVEDSCSNPNVGPDIVVGDLHQTAYFGEQDGMLAYAVGTVSCNWGDEGVIWIAGNNQHPVIGQNLYRLKDGQFEQLGMSWLKHGYLALAQDFCCECENPGTGTILGVGCSDPYGAQTNGSQSGLGPRWEVDPFSGDFPFPFTTAGQSGDTLYKRIQVPVEDMQPENNEGARYFVEGQYVHPEEAAYGNQFNNVSYREVAVSPGSTLTLSFVGTTQVTEPAVMAWAAAQADVHVEVRDFPEKGRVFLASGTRDNGDGTWRYDYVIYNMNHSTGLGGLRVPVDLSAAVTDDSFHGVPHHSGDPQESTPWTFSRDASGVEWRAEPLDQNPNANLVTWGTLYSVSFVSDRAPILTDCGVGRASSTQSDEPMLAWAPDSTCGVTRYCKATANSTGAPAAIDWSGSTSVSANAAALLVSGLPANQPGLFFYGPNEVSVPFGDGNRCVGGSLTRLNPAIFADAAGDAQRDLDFNASTLAGVGPGDTLRVQCWYRDPAAGAAGFNLSDALSATLCP